MQNLPHAFGMIEEVDRPVNGRIMNAVAKLGGQIEQKAERIGARAARESGEPLAARPRRSVLERLGCGQFVHGSTDETDELAGIVLAIP